MLTDGPPFLPVWNISTRGPNDDGLVEMHLCVPWGVAAEVWSVFLTAQLEATKKP